MTISHEQAHSENQMPEVRTVKVTLGSDLVLQTGGAYVYASSKVDGRTSLSTRIPFDATNPATEALLPFGGARTIATLQPDDGFDFVGTSRTFYISARTKGALTFEYIVKGGSVNASQPVNLKVYRGSSAGDILPANLFYEANLPAHLWAGNGTEFGFKIDAYGVDDYAGLPFLDIVPGVGTILVFNSAATFSAKLNNAQTSPYLKADQVEITERVACDQFTTRSPFLSLDHPPGVFPLVLGDNIITSWVEGDNNFFDYDSGTGYYTYTGEDTPFMKANTDVSAVSNTTNCYVQQAIDVDNGVTVTRVLGPAREFDGANDGAFTWTSKARIVKGDRIRHLLVASKVAPNFTIQYMGKLVEKVS